jgi:hypothetical protein
MRLPWVDRNASGLVNQMSNVRNRDDCWLPAQKKGQMALAMGMGPHRLIQLVDGHSAEGAMADRQSGTHTLPPHGIRYCFV